MHVGLVRQGSLSSSITSVPSLPCAFSWAVGMLGPDLTQPRRRPQPGATCPRPGAPRPLSLFVARPQAAATSIRWVLPFQLPIQLIIFLVPYRGYSMHHRSVVHAMPSLHPPTPPSSSSLLSSFSCRPSHLVSVLLALLPSFTPFCQCCLIKHDMAFHH